MEQINSYELIINDEILNNLFNVCIQQCKLAIEKNEVPVACVFYNLESKQIIAKNHNLTNIKNNATAHAEINCIEEITQTYGKQIFEKCILVVSCEPCIMCAYTLGLLNIKAVFFGCYNEKFGGNGSVVELNNGLYGVKNYPSFGGFRTNECISILKQFYESGNLKLEEDKRHRRGVNKD